MCAFVSISDGAPVAFIEQIVFEEKETVVGFNGVSLVLHSYDSGNAQIFKLQYNGSTYLNFYFHSAQEVLYNNLLDAFSIADRNVDSFRSEFEEFRSSVAVHTKHIHFVSKKLLKNIRNRWHRMVLTGGEYVEYLNDKFDIDMTVDDYKDYADFFNGECGEHEHCFLPEFLYFVLDVGIEHSYKHLHSLFSLTSCRFVPLVPVVAVEDVHLQHQGNGRKEEGDGGHEHLNDKNSALTKLTTGSMLTPRARTRTHEEYLDNDRTGQYNPHVGAEVDVDYVTLEDLMRTCDESPVFVDEFSLDAYMTVRVTKVHEESGNFYVDFKLKLWVDLSGLQGRFDLADYRVVDRIMDLGVQVHNRVHFNHGKSVIARVDDTDLYETNLTFKKVLLNRSQEDNAYNDKDTPFNATRLNFLIILNPAVLRFNYNDQNTFVLSEDQIYKDVKINWSLNICKFKQNMVSIDELTHANSLVHFSLLTGQQSVGYETIDASRIKYHVVMYHDFEFVCMYFYLPYMFCCVLVFLFSQPIATQVGVISYLVTTKYWMSHFVPDSLRIDTFSVVAGLMALLIWSKVVYEQSGVAEWFYLVQGLFYTLVFLLSFHMLVYLLKIRYVFTEFKDKYYPACVELVQEDYLKFDSNYHERLYLHQLQKELRWSMYVSERDKLLLDYYKLNYKFDNREREDNREKLTFHESYEYILTKHKLSHLYDGALIDKWIYKWTYFNEFKHELDAMDPQARAIVQLYAEEAQLLELYEVAAKHQAGQPLNPSELQLLHKQVALNTLPEVLTAFIKCNYDRSYRYADYKQELTRKMLLQGLWLGVEQIVDLRWVSWAIGVLLFATMTTLFNVVEIY